MNETFLVGLLGIIKFKDKILIVKRENDTLVKELKWCFPGGSLETGKNVEECLKEKIKKKVGLDISVKQLLLVRVPEENKNFLLIYYHCEAKNDKIIINEEFMDAKWIKPKDYKNYFTTSIDEKLIEFLKKL